MGSQNESMARPILFYIFFFQNFNRPLENLWAFEEKGRNRESLMSMLEQNKHQIWIAFDRPKNEIRFIITLIVL